jgi:hypothetical protein
MASRRHNPRRAKSHFSYTIHEVAELYDVGRSTVRHWLASGLEPNDGGKPILIHGSELNRFHAIRRELKKRPCGPGELFCLGCRAPRRPAGSMADFTPGLGTSGTVEGICPVCGRMMSQRVNATRLSRLRVELDVATRPLPEPIGES